MQLRTMSAVMNHVTKLEHDSADLYVDCASRQVDMKEMLLAWEKENRKFEKQVKQTYFGVITDTLESNYAFEGLDSDDFEPDMSMASATDAASVALKISEIEKVIRDFYLKAADLSQGLMADIPRLFRKIAKKRDERLESLKN